MFIGEEYVFVVESDSDRQRADKVVHSFKSDLSRSQIQKLFEKGLVWREDEALRKAQKVHLGDRISFNIPPPRPLDLRPVDLPLSILHEDEDIIVINKATGMITHPGAGTGEDTLVHALLHHCAGSLSGIGGVERPGIVHRLDKETSGVMVVAKSDAAFLELSKAFSERRVQKTYLALIRNTHIEPRGIIEAPIGRHPTHRTRMAVTDDGRPARSDWRLLKRYAEGGGLVEVQIHTGRTHQIRVHMSHLGCPIAGDRTYGWRKPHNWKIDADRVMLHAAELSFTHPVNGLLMTFKAPLAEDMQALVERLCQQFGSQSVA